MLVVISILTVFLGFIVFPGRILYNSYRRASFVQSVIFELHNARFHARLSGEEVVASFEDSTFTISIGDRRIVDKNLYLPVQKSKTFIFLPNGRPRYPGTVLFIGDTMSTAKIILSKQGRIRHEK